MKKAKKNKEPQNPTLRVGAVSSRISEPKLLDILLLTKLSDGTVRQIIVDKQQAKYILDLLIQTSKSRKVNIHKPIVSGIDFEARWNLSEEYGC